MTGDSKKVERQATRELRNGSLRSNCAEEKPMTIPFVDEVKEASGGGNKKKESVASMDTIPLLAKSAGLRTDDPMIGNAAIIDNLQSEDGSHQPMENGFGDRSPTIKTKASNGGGGDFRGSTVILSNGGGGGVKEKPIQLQQTIWGSGAGDMMALRTEFISTIST